MFISAQVQRQKNVNSDDFWFSPIGGATDSGVRVSSTLAMQLSISYACDRVLSETIAQLPLISYMRRVADDGRDRDTTADISKLLHDQPNENMTSFEFRRLMQHNVNMRGNAYAEIIFLPNGRIDALIPLHPDWVTIQLMKDGSLRYTYTDPWSREKRIILSSSMFHIKGYSDDGLVGLNPIQVQRNSIATTIAGRAYDARFFANDAQTPGVVTMPGSFQDSDDRAQWLKDYNKRHRGKRQHSIELFEFGMEYTATAMKNIDAQFIEGMKYRDVDVARIFRVQNHKVGILDDATFSNIEEQNIDFVQNTILPIAVNWEQAIKRDLIINDNLFAEFLLEGLLRGDTKAQTEAASKAIFGGWMNRNEVRRLQNMNPVEGLSEFLEPVNTREAGSSSNNNDIRGSALTERGKNLAHKAAERIVNKSIVATRKAYKKYMTGSDGADPEAMLGWVKDFYAGHGEFVSDVMVTDKDTGERYAAGTMNATIGAVVAEMHGHGNMVESLMAEWEIDRASHLAKVGVFNNG